MPLLPKELDILPENLFELPVEELPWGVAHVRSRQEKVLARFLVQREIPFYLPLTTAKKKRAGRTFESHLPLFPGYVFFRAPAGGRDAIWRSNVAVALLEVADPIALGRELEQIRRLQLSGASLQPCRELAAGDAVRIAEGSFAGYSGVIVRERGRDRLIVSISLIRQAVAVEFDRDMLRKTR